MMAAGRLVAAVVAVTLVHVCNVYLIGNGFFLRRVPLEAVANETFESRTADYDRLVIVVVDALRYDFVAHIDPNGPEYNPHHHNQLTSLQR